MSKEEVTNRLTIVNDKITVIHTARKEGKIEFFTCEKHKEFLQLLEEQKKLNKLLFDPSTDSPKQ